MITYMTAYMIVIFFTIELMNNTAYVSIGLYEHTAKT